MRRTSSKRLLAVIVTVAAIAGCAAAPPKHFMTDNNRLTACSSAPHCVSSQAPPDSARHIKPFVYATSAAVARKALLATLDAQRQAKLVTSGPRFIHATFRTTLGFVDDVTFLIRPDARVIDVKSSSRIGYYDFGVNRHRVERLRKAFEARLARR